jgi:hypothetical protein
MFKKLFQSWYVVTAVLPALLLVLVSACDETIITPDDQDDYRVEGVVVSDPNLESTLISKSFKTVARFTQGNAVPDGGQIAFAGDQLTLFSSRYDIDSIYALANNMTYAYTNSNRTVELSDSNDFAHTVIVSVPDSFSIDNIVPANHLLQGLEQLSLEWTGSNRVESYVMAVVLEDSAYTGYGFSLYADEQATSGTIPPDAFSLTDGINPDLGLYVVYLYAITGVPDTLLANALLPVPLPGQLADNVSGPALTGRFGSVVVTAYDTVRVVQQP